MSDSFLGNPLADTDEVKLELFNVSPGSDEPNPATDAVAALDEQLTECGLGRELRRPDRTWRNPASGQVRDHPTLAFAHWPTLPEYVILGELGRGGMGVVYLAHQKGLQRVVALKMINAHSAREEGDALLRFRAEAEAAAHLQHPNIVQIYDIGEWHGLPFFSLEFMEGGSLDTSLARKPQPPATAAQLVETLARAAHHAHTHGVIHRDLKPSNILLTCDGVPKISDFGLAKRLDQSGSTKSGEIMGTPSYMAPEQASATTQPIGPTTDVYALGAILYEMLTGRPPFLGSSAVETVLLVRCQEALPPRRLQPGIPRDLETICLKCLEKPPHKRYGTAQELADDLRRFQAGDPIQARPTAWWEKVWKWARRRPTITALMGVLLLATLALILLTLHHIATVEHERRFAQAHATLALAEKSRAEKQREEAQEHRDAAEASYRLAREAVDEFVQLVRKDPRLQGDSLADVRKTLTQTALKYYQGLVRQNPQDPELRVDQGRACWMLADLLADYDSKAKSIQWYEDAKGIFQKLVDEEPANARYQFFLAQNHVNLGYMQFETGTYAPVEAHYAQARAILTKLLESDAEHAEYLHVLAKIEGNFGCLLTQVGRCNEAEKHFLEALELDRKLLAREPQRTDLRNRFGHDLASLGITYRQLGRHQEAEQAHRDAIDVFEKLARQHPKEYRYQIPIARGHGYLGFIKRDLKQLSLAEVELFLALEHHEALAREEPLITSHRSDIGITCNDLGNIFRDRHDFDRAVTMFQRAAEVQRGLVDRDPQNLNFQVSLAGSLCNQAHVTRDSGRRESSLEPYTQAIELLEGVLDQEPTHERAKLFLRNAAWGRASALTMNGAFAEALPDWDRAIELDSGHNVTGFSVQRAECLMRLGRHAEATDAIDRLLQGRREYRHLHYSAAAVFALAAATVAKDTTLDSTQRLELAGQHTTRALELLAEAKGRGYFARPPQSRYVLTDRRFDSIRDHAEFKKLLAELQAPPPAAPPPEKPSP